ncbi:MAG TPA: L,D-transpeptidase [Opitutaceae bacterium]|nr:L,D-transpeptidase [Opitutaceae bacterium]
MRSLRDSLTSRWVIALVLVFLAIGVSLRLHPWSRHPARHRRGAPATAIHPAAPAQQAARPKTSPALPPQPAASSSPAAPAPLVTPPAIDTFPRPVTTWLEAQIELARRGISSGSIDGIGGAQSVAALRAFQENEGLEATGQLDPETRARLVLSAPPLAPITVTAEDLAGLQPLSPTWLGKSQQTALAFETALELVAERSHANPALLRQLNPSVDWAAISPATSVLAPAVGRVEVAAKVALLRLRLGDHVLEARDDAGSLLAHFPVSIARDVEKRPVGGLHVTVIIPNPDFTFDPEVFPESAEARELGRKLILPPGPNNPVGVAWIGLDRTGYGIHGTPSPEQVGRTESHGCFRLANWDASTLLDLVWVGLPVMVEP